MRGQRNYRLLHNRDHGLCRWYLCSDKATCFHFHSVHSHNILQHFPYVSMTTGQTGCGSGNQQIGRLAGKGLRRDKITKQLNQVSCSHAGLLVTLANMWTNTCSDCKIIAGLAGAVLMAGCDKNSVLLLAEELRQGAVS